MSPEDARCESDPYRAAITDVTQWLRDPRTAKALRAMLGMNHGEARRPGAKLRKLADEIERLFNTPTRETIMKRAPIAYLTPIGAIAHDAVAKGMEGFVPPPGASEPETFTALQRKAEDVLFHALLGAGMKQEAGVLVLPSGETLPGPLFTIILNGMGDDALVEFHPKLAELFSLPSPPFWPPLPRGNDKSPPSE